ncbi:protoheme IX farnesyltransferase [bacterium]|nr:protoheme IX farnesyltransferase [bacterium]
MLRDLLELSKARLCMMVVVTTVVGYLLATVTIDWAVLAATVVGTTLTAFGANALNQYRERDVDRLMERTRERPLAAGRMAPATALIYGVAVSMIGTFVLLAFSGWLPAVLAAATVLLYVLVYTPLKRISTINTLIGAVCGAIPPLIGWSAGTGGLELGGWMLFALLFVWQMPHFLSLAWMYREDYARGGLRMLPVVDPGGRLTFPVTVLFAALHLPLGLLVTVAGIAGPWFAVGSLLLGIWWGMLGLRLYRTQSDRDARRVFLASLAYLPLALMLMVADRGPGRAEDMWLESSPRTPTVAVVEETR